MMIAIPLGYFVACFLIIAGFLGGMDFLGNRPADISRAELLVKLSAAAWPMIAGCGLLLLIQITKQIENLRLVASYTPEEESAPKKKKKKAANKSKEEAESTPAPPPAPAPEPQPAPTPAPAPAPVKIQGVITIPDVAGSALNSAQSAHSQSLLMKQKISVLRNIIKFLPHFQSTVVVSYLPKILLKLSRHTTQKTLPRK